jgi:ferritin-like metal-binding protein YciE
MAIGETDVASLLEDDLEEEKSAHKKLASVASSVNKQARRAA